MGVSCGIYFLHDDRWDTGKEKPNFKFCFLGSMHHKQLELQKTKLFSKGREKKEIWLELADENKARPSSKERIQSNYPNKPDAISQISAASETQKKRKKKKQLMPEKYLRSDNKINT